MIVFGLATNCLEEWLSLPILFQDFYLDWHTSPYSPDGLSTLLCQITMTLSVVLLWCSLHQGSQRKKESRRGHWVSKTGLINPEWIENNLFQQSIPRSFQYGWVTKAHCSSHCLVLNVTKCYSYPIYDLLILASMTHIVMMFEGFFSFFIRLCCF